MAVVVAGKKEETSEPQKEVLCEPEKEDLSDPTALRPSRKANATPKLQKKKIPIGKLPPCFDVRTLENYEHNRLYRSLLLLPV